MANFVDFFASNNGFSHCAFRGMISPAPMEGRPQTAREQESHRRNPGRSQRISLLPRYSLFYRRFLRWEEPGVNVD